MVHCGEMRVGRDGANVALYQSVLGPGLFGFPTGAVGRKVPYSLVNKAKFVNRR